MYHAPGIQPPQTILPPSPSRTSPLNLATVEEIAKGSEERLDDLFIPGREIRSPARRPPDGHVSRMADLDLGLQPGVERGGPPRDAVSVHSVGREGFDVRVLASRRRVEQDPRQAAQRGVHLAVGDDLAEDLGVRGGGGGRGVGRGDVVELDQGVAHGLRVVVGQLDVEARVARGRVDELVEFLFVADLAEEHRDARGEQAGREGARVHGGEEGGRDEVVVRAGAEGVDFQLEDGGDQVLRGDLSERGEFVPGAGIRGDGEDGAEVVELRGQYGCGRAVGLDGDGVGPQVDPADEALGWWEEGVVVELEKGRVRARRETSHGDVLGIAPEMRYVLCRPLQSGSLVPEAVVRGRRVFMRRGQVLAREEAE